MEPRDPEMLPWGLNSSPSLHLGHSWDAALLMERGKEFSTENEFLMEDKSFSGKITLYLNASLILKCFIYLSNKLHSVLMFLVGLKYSSVDALN